MYNKIIKGKATKCNPIKSEIEATINTYLTALFLKEYSVNFNEKSGIFAFIIILPATVITSKNEVF